MGIHLTHNKIMDLCGSVSFKRGEMYYRAEKVMIEEYSDTKCKAIVEGKENFHVVIDFENDKELRTECNCPSLPLYRYKCQHVAAVLIAMNEQIKAPTEETLTEGLLALFNGRQRPSGHQLHFEDREVLELAFTLLPVATGKGHMLGIELKVEGVQVEDVRQFLEDVNEGRASSLSTAFTFDANLHCFKREADAVLQKLVEINNGAFTYHRGGPQTLIIPPSSWEKLLQVLNEAPEVALESVGKQASRLHIREMGMPVRFHFEKRPGKGHSLKIDGVERVIILQPYNLVYYDGQLFRLTTEDCKRLADLKQMVETSGTHQLPIPNEQIGFFIEKVVPGLRRIGEVQLDETVLDQLVKSPLNAKLYLDRVNNRLLAGLEFQYDHITINPLVERELPASSVLVRDLEKEEEILQLMEESSFAQTDEGYLLHNEELEYEFLYNTLPKLEKLVRVYATTAIRIRIFRGAAKPRIRVKAFEDQTNWLEFKFSMDGIPDKQIRGILEALEEKRKYYRLRSGALLSLETREFEEIRRFMNELPGELDELEKGLNMPITRGISFLDKVGEDEMLAIEDSARQFLERLLHPENTAWEIPVSLENVLRDYQKTGFKWMKTIAEFGVGGVLADDMGLGKTLQSIAFIVSELPKVRSEKRPVLIICPSSLTYNWLSELKKFAPEMKAIVLDGNKKERAGRQADTDGKDVLITSYPLIRRDVAWYEKQHFHTVFFDEAQAFKNPFTQTARSVKKLRATHRFALTGTPIENALEELWSIFHVVFPELFMGLREFSELSRKTVARRIRPFLLRRLKEDVLEELPNKVESIESSELLPAQKELYAAYLAKLRHDTLRHLDKDTVRKNKIRILAGLTRLRQICCHPALFVDGYEGRSAKYEQLKQLIGESKRAGRRVLIFSQFTKMLDIIGKDLALEGTPFFYLDGSTPSEERLELCDRFNAGERDLFLISLKAGGTGLNLTGADTVILYDLWWNPAVEEQAADRAHRIGQKHTVHVIKLVARGTVEDKMNELQERKRNLIGEVIDTEMGSLTEEDLLDLLEI